MAFVLDASVTLGWCFRDEENAFAHRVLRRLRDDSAWAPAVWPLEVGNGFALAERRGRFSTADSAEALVILSDLPITVHALTLEDALGPVLDLARAQGLSVYDAAYLHLAMREGLPLATLDDDLRAAASRVGVSLIA
jgi:predicted nucleic acid-binding protein